MAAISEIKECIANFYNKFLFRKMTIQVTELQLCFSIQKIICNGLEQPKNLYWA